jgi:serine/threonine protein kinase
VLFVLSFQRQIGEGAFGFVYEVKTASWGVEKKKYALKKLICQTPEQIDEARKEVRLMRSISHANVMSIVATTAKNKKDGRVEILFLLPLFQTSLQSLIDNGPGYPHSVFCGNSQLFFDVCIGFCRGLLAIHEYNYRHCDFKPANVLINFDCREFSKKIPDAPLSAVVVTDLGSACTPLVHEVKNRADALVCPETCLYVTVILL